MNEPFIQYGNCIIWPTRDDRGKCYAEVTDRNAKDLYCTPDKYSDKEQAIQDAKDWIDRKEGIE